MDDKNYADFLDITGASRAFTQDINDFLLSNGCKRDIKTAKSGFTVSYTATVKKRSCGSYFRMLVMKIFS